MRKLLATYININLHVSVAVASLAIFSYLSNNLEIDWSYIMFLFFSTMSLYALHRIIGDIIRKVKDENKREEPLKYIYIFIITISTILSLYSYLSLNQVAQINLILPIIMSIAYISPIFNQKRLRDLPLIKIFMIAISWAILCVYIPLINADSNINYSLISRITSMMFFVFALTIPFDIRDFEIDKRTNTITIPIKYGILPSVRIAHISLILIISTSMIFLKTSTLDPIYEIVMIISAIIVAPFISRTRPNSPMFYVSGLIEGLLMLPILLYFLLDHLSF